MYREMSFSNDDEKLMLRPFMLVQRGMDGRLYIKGYVPGFGRSQSEVRSWNPANPICEALETQNRVAMLTALDGKGVPSWVREATAYFKELMVADRLPLL
jgi:hypothetical protein